MVFVFKNDFALGGDARELFLLEEDDLVFLKAKVFVLFKEFFRWRMRRKTRHNVPRQTDTLCRIG